MKESLISITHITEAAQPAMWGLIWHWDMWGEELVAQNCWSTQFCFSGSAISFP